MIIITAAAVKDTMIPFVTVMSIGIVVIQKIILAAAMSIGNIVTLVIGF